MRAVELLIRGLLAGLVIAVPVGPVNVLCISRTISKGWKSGLLSGFGAASADTVYGCIAGFSITFVIQFLIREESWIRLIGGILLVGIGARYYFKPAQPLTEEKSESAEHSDYMSALLLTLTNPTTVLSFLTVMAALGIGRKGETLLTLFLVLGIFCGSMLWWIVLTAIVNRLRNKFNDPAMKWLNRIAGLAIGSFGVASFALSRWHAR
jgi:threonine/homoserine/homoserine lactone efflux protein